MIINIAVILILLAVAYLLAARGFFSALLALAASVAAGAVAFAVWEPLALYLLESVNSDWLNDQAWGLALVVPYAVTVAAIIAGLAAFLRANVQVAEPYNLVGGLLCGAGAGVITAGIASIALAGVRSPTDFMGLQPFTYDRGGSLVRTAPLWVPVDRIVVGVYGRLSESTLRTGTSMARWYPHLADRGHLIRVGPDGQTLRTVVRPGDIEFVGRYTVGQDGAIPTNQLLSDTFPDGSTPQKLRTLDGDDVTAGSYQLEGYVVRLKGGTREKGGQVISGPGHFQLLIRDDADTQSAIIIPFAMISQAQGDQTFIGRWRFDGEKVFIGSVGGGADPLSAFEFLMPKGWRPIALYARGLRFDLTKGEGGAQSIDPFQRFASVAARDAAVASRALFDAAASGGGPEGDGEQLRTGGDGPSREIVVSNRLPVRFIKGSVSGLNIDDKNSILNGEVLTTNDRLATLGGTDRSLLIERILVDPTVVIVQANLGSESALSITAPASDGDGAPALFDDKNQRYDAVGYIYQDNTTTRFRFTPDRPLTRADLPSMSRSRTDQKLSVLFRVSFGVSVTSYAIGSKVVKRLTPPIELNMPQSDR